MKLSKSQLTEVLAIPVTLAARVTASATAAITLWVQRKARQAEWAITAVAELTGKSVVHKDLQAARDA